MKMNRNISLNRSSRIVLSLSARAFIRIHLRYLRAICLVLFSLLIPVNGLADEASPIVRTRLDPTGSVMVGQPVTLTVEILVPTWFLKAPKFPISLNVPNAIAEYLEGSNVNLSERIGSDTWAGLSRQYRVYPQLPGKVEIPSVEISIVYALPDASPSEPLTVSSRPLTVTARIPSQAADLGYFISTSKFTLRQSLDPDPKDLKVGESLTRTITMTVAESSTMMLPPVTFEPIEGLAVYPAPPIIKDTGGERGEARIGTRVDEVTYIVQEEGDFTLPEIELQWWDLKAGRLRVAKLPSIAFNATPNPDLVQEIALPVEEIEETTGGKEPDIGNFMARLRDWLPWILAVSFLAAFFLRFYGGPLNRIVSRLTGPRDADPRREASARFNAFRKACMDGDPGSALNHLLNWLDLTGVVPGPPTLQEFVKRSGNRLFEEQANELTTLLFGSNGDGAWDGREFYRQARKARELWVGKKQPAGGKGTELPGLNP
jgi:hypothetical protein